MLLLDAVTVEVVVVVIIAAASASLVIEYKKSFVRQRRDGIEDS